MSNITSVIREKHGQSVHSGLSTNNADEQAFADVVVLVVKPA